jgi:hypothetical protein
MLMGIGMPRGIGPLSSPFRQQYIRVATTASRWRVDHTQVGTDLCPALSLKTEETC